MAGFVGSPPLGVDVRCRHALPGRVCTRVPRLRDRRGTLALFKQPVRLAPSSRRRAAQAWPFCERMNHACCSRRRM